jgi:hypothetical protein
MKTAKIPLKNEKCDYFLTTDDKVLKRNNQISDIHVTDPIAFIKEVLS